MDEKKQKGVTVCFPIITFIIILASLLSSIFPELESAFIFDRSALIRGEFWRIFTCHFVHFSNTHLTYNLITFGIAGYVFEKKNYSYFFLLLLCLAFSISISLLTLKPNMRYYGGLSGVVCGVLYYCALMGIKETRPWQTICFLTVLFLPIKIAVEIYNSASVLPYFGNQSFIPMQTSHIAGCLAAVSFYFSAQKRDKDLASQLKQTANDPVPGGSSLH
ncbi:MAG: rhombosortase [Desulfobacterales bacterium]|nr:MAG: rhombosortase [Desulfobacterales bacterium]